MSQISCMPFSPAIAPAEVYGLKLLPILISGTV